MGQGDGIYSYYQSKIEELEVVVREKTQNLRRLEAQRNELNSKGARPPVRVSPPTGQLRARRRTWAHATVRMLREELQLLQEPGSYVGEVTKVMGRKKVLVKVGSQAPAAWRRARSDQPSLRCAGAPGGQVRRGH